jgi:hypothetical protein
LDILVFFAIFFQKWPSRYSFARQSLRNNRPISTGMGIISADIALDKAPVILV